MNGWMGGSLVNLLFHSQISLRERTDSEHNVTGQILSWGKAKGEKNLLSSARGPLHQGRIWPCKEHVFPVSENLICHMAKGFWSGIDNSAINLCFAPDSLYDPQKSQPLGAWYHSLLPGVKISGQPKKSGLPENCLCDRQG